MLVAAFLVTADRGMNAKTRCWEFEKVCAARGVPLRKAFSAGRDRHVKHNRGCSGAAYVYLKSPEDDPRVREIIGNTKGAERVLPREEAAREVRSHGSLHEIEMPIFLYNAKGAPSADYFRHNLDLACWLYPA